MSNVYDLVERAFEERLDSFPYLPDAGVAYANEQFNRPDPDASWFQAKLIPGTPSRKVLGPDGYSRLDGAYMINMFYPKGEGSGTARRAADQLIQWFKSGTRLRAGDVFVSCLTASRAGADDSGEWYQIPVSIYWYTHRNEV